MNLATECRRIIELRRAYAADTNTHGQTRKRAPAYNLNEIGRIPGSAPDRVATLIAQRGQVTTAEAARELEISRNTVNVACLHLKRSGVIRRVGHGVYEWAE